MKSEATAKRAETDLSRTGPETLMGRYMRLFWQPVYRAEDLPRGKAIPLEIMSELFTLYRGQSGKPYLVAYRCAHRRAPLNVGWVEDDRIRCRYHGWKYEGTGQCVETPSDEPSLAAKVRIASYPVKEYLGMIWAYLGEGEPPPFRRLPDFEKPGLVLANTPRVWPCNFFNQMDNDPYHPAWAHREATKRAGLAVQERNSIVTLETDFGIAVFSPDGSSASYRLIPNLTIVSRLRPTGGSRVIGARGAKAAANATVVLTMPVNDEKCMITLVDHVAVTGEEAEKYLEQYRNTNAKIDYAKLNTLGEAVLAGKVSIEELDSRLTTFEMFWIEDYSTQVGQGKLAEHHKERLGRIDGSVILLRKILRRELENLADGKPLKQWAQAPADLVDEVPLHLLTRAGEGMRELE